VSATGLEALAEESAPLNELLVEATRALPADAWSTPEGLASLRDGSRFPVSPPLPDTEVLHIDGAGGPIELRVRRTEAAPAGVYLELHGGGWCIGSAAAGDEANAALVGALDVATVGVDYRLAPEHPFPAALDDAEAAACWLAEHALERFGTDRLVIGGSSAGAHLAVTTLLRLRERGLAGAFAGANLVYGCYDLGLTPSQRHGTDAALIPTAVLEQCFANVLPGLDREARRDPAWSPLYADLHALPPALLTVGDLDPLLDDSVFLAGRWSAAANHAVLAVYPGSVHGFAGFPTAMAARAHERIRAFVRDCVAG
jgi:acetyl esterase/lipase